MAHPQLQQRTALRTIVRLHKRPPPIRGVLARHAASGVGLDLQSLRRNRLPANLADYNLLPFFAIVLRRIERDPHPCRFAFITGKPAAMREKHLAHNLLRRISRPPKMSARSKPAHNRRLAAQRSPTAS